MSSQPVSKPLYGVGRRLALVTILALNLSACSRMQHPVAIENYDPLEKYNRKIFSFNRLVDGAIIRPVAKFYHDFAPPPVRKAVGNFFSNLDDCANIFNELMQLKGHDAVSDFWRVTINSSIGVGGLFDVASDLDFPKHQQDFGLTLSYWGVKPSVYFVLPFIGPRTIDSLLGFAVDSTVLSPANYIDDNLGTTFMHSLKLVDMRSDYLDFEKVICHSVDPYAMQRDVYVNYRLNLINHNAGFSEVVAETQSKEDADEEAFLFDDADFADGADVMQSQ